MSRESKERRPSIAVHAAGAIVLALLTYAYGDACKHLRANLLLLVALIDAGLGRWVGAAVEALRVGHALLAIDAPLESLLARAFDHTGDAIVV
jgi:hypothetical protein